jgi:hypothetical protein
VEENVVEMGMRLSSYCRTMSEGGGSEVGVVKTDLSASHEYTSIR